MEISEILFQLDEYRVPVYSNGSPISGTAMAEMQAIMDSMIPAEDPCILVPEDMDSMLEMLDRLVEECRHPILEKVGR